MGDHVQTWENYQKFADQRAWLVVTILRQFTFIKGKNILDFGCGDGATSRRLAEFGAKVTAVDINDEIELTFKNTNIKFFNARNEELYFKNQQYDIIVLQDVLEHVPSSEKLIERAKHSLRTWGLIYISTPNRFSLLNIISDPHWNLPGVALGSRSMVIFLVQRVFHRDRRNRSDWAALLSLNKLKKLLKINDIEMIFVNRLVAKILFQKPPAVVCHPKHIRLVQWMKDHYFYRWINQLVSDRIGLFNFLINPTWYVIGRIR